MVDTSQPDVESLPFGVPTSSHHLSSRIQGAPGPHDDNVLPSNHLPPPFPPAPVIPQRYPVPIASSNLLLQRQWHSCIIPQEALGGKGPEGPREKPETIPHVPRLGYESIIHLVTTQASQVDIKHTGIPRKTKKTRKGSVCYVPCLTLTQPEPQSMFAIQGTFTREPNHSGSLESQTYFEQLHATPLGSQVQCQKK